MEYLNKGLELKRKLEDRTKRFAVGVFKFIDQLPTVVSSRVIAYQIGKSASSIGANYREANRAESRDDFVHKIGIVLKEVSETEYWLMVLKELYPKSEKLNDLIAEVDELLRIFQSTNRSLRTNKSNKSKQSTNTID